MKCGPQNGVSRQSAASFAPNGNSYHGVVCMNVPYSRAVRAANASSGVSFEAIHSVTRPIVFSYTPLIRYSTVKLVPITPSIMW